MPLSLDASLRLLDSSGRPLKTVSAEAQLTRTDDGRVARYRILDAFGSVRDEMSITLGGAQADFSYATGDPPESAPLPDLFASIAGTGVSWMELSFSFFWWEHPRIIGSEKVANRWECQMCIRDRAIKDMKVPEGVIIVTALRGGKVLTPTGDLVLVADDHIVVYLSLIHI